MAISVVMPALEMAQETGKLLAWRKKEGERVSKGEPLLEIETDKAVVEIEAPADGVLAGVSADVGAIIPVGETIAWLVSPGEQPPATSKTAAASAAARASITTSRPDASSRPVEAPSDQSSSPPQISPKARRVAKELGVDIARVRGTGPGGAITTEDVQAFAIAKDGSRAAALEGEAPSQVARLMAERTTQSWTTVPHFFLVRDVDAGALQSAQERLGQQTEKSHGVRATITDLLIALVARALIKHPRLNSSWSEDRVRPNKDINISVAIAVKDGVVGAVIANADKAAPGAISVQRRDLTERARAGRLRSADIANGTFTISNLGMYKVDAFTAIIVPPQAGILAVGAISDRVVAVDGKPCIQPMVTLTLSSDHRVVDGAAAAAFLNDLVEALRQPDKWLD
jgi:pyruvate dehydrogenase E2 component (dihydrolipoamide acetyltransferase)